MATLFALSVWSALCTMKWELSTPVAEHTLNNLWDDAFSKECDFEFDSSDDVPAIISRRNCSFLKWNCLMLSRNCAPAFVWIYLQRCCLWPLGPSLNWQPENWNRRRCQRCWPPMLSTVSPVIRHYSQHLRQSWSPWQVHFWVPIRLPASDWHRFVDLLSLSLCVLSAAAARCWWRQWRRTRFVLFSCQTCWKMHNYLLQIHSLTYVYQALNVEFYSRLAVVLGLSANDRLWPCYWMREHFWIVKNCSALGYHLFVTFCNLIFRMGCAYLECGNNMGDVLNMGVGVVGCSDVAAVSGCRKFFRCSMRSWCCVRHLLIMSGRLSMWSWKRNV